MGQARTTGLIPATARAPPRLVMSSTGSLPARPRATSLSSAIALLHVEVGEKGTDHVMHLRPDSGNGSAPMVSLADSRNPAGLA